MIFTNKPYSLRKSGFPRINVWGTSAEILFWLSVLSKFSTNQKHYPSLGSDALSVWRLFRGFTGKSRLFAQATFSVVSYFKLNRCERFARTSPKVGTKT